LQEPKKKNSKKLLDEEDMVVERFYGPTKLKAQLRWKNQISGQCFAAHGFGIVSSSNLLVRLDLACRR
jgi:hypothetical protein